MSVTINFVLVGTRKSETTTLEKFLRGRDYIQLVHNREGRFNQFDEELHALIRKGIEKIRYAALGRPSDAANSPCVGHSRVDYCLFDKALECIRRKGAKLLIFSHRKPMEQL